MSDPQPVAARPLNVQLIQISHGQQGTLYMPYSVALLQAYAQHHAQAPGRYEFAPLLYERVPVAENLAQIQQADVLGFSVYVWSINYSLALAQGAKALNPEVLTIFGGPQVPDHAESFLRANPCIDVCSHGEGEQVFLNLLESLPDKNWETLSGISWLDQAGVFHYNPPGSRIDNLDDIPSPFTSGVFDPIMRPNRNKWIAMWESNRGCPFSCTYCDWGSAIASKVRRYSTERLKADIDWFAANGIEMISCADANFGILPRDLELTDYLLEVKERTGLPTTFFYQGAKNTTERSYAVQSKLVKSGLHKMVTIALQSVTPAVLTSIRRDNISLDAYAELQRRFSRDGVPTYSDILIGLPGETYDSFADGVCKVIDEGQHNWIYLYITFVLPNAEMAQPAYREKHGLQTVQIPFAAPQYPLQMEITEWQEIVIATNTMNRDDWRRSRTFGWWVRILYHNMKLLQLPIMLLHYAGGLGLREIFEFFNESVYPPGTLLGELQSFLQGKAQRIQQGGEPEHCALANVANPHWVTLDNYILTGLARPDMARTFFSEAGQMLRALHARCPNELPIGALIESLQLSEGIFVSPMTRQPFMLEGSYNLWDWYQACVTGDIRPVTRESVYYVRSASAEPSFNVNVQKRQQVVMSTPGGFQAPFAN